MYVEIEDEVKVEEEKVTNFWVSKLVVGRMAIRPGRRWRCRWSWRCVWRWKWDLQ